MAGITAEFTGDSSSCCLSQYASFTNPPETTLTNSNTVEMSFNVVTKEFNWVGTDSFSDQTAFGTFIMTYTLTDAKGGQSILTQDIQVIEPLPTFATALESTYNILTGQSSTQALPSITAGKYDLSDVTLEVSPADYSTYITLDKADLAALKLQYTDDAAVNDILAKEGSLTFTLHNSNGDTKVYTKPFTVELYVAPVFAENLPLEMTLYQRLSKSI